MSVRIKQFPLSSLIVQYQCPPVFGWLDPSISGKHILPVLSLLIIPPFSPGKKRYIDCSYSTLDFCALGKNKYYKTITEKQLTPLKSYKNFKIKYFPDSKPHILNEYFKWKADSIKAL